MLNCYTMFTYFTCHPKGSVKETQLISRYPTNRLVWTDGRFSHKSQHAGPQSQENVNTRGDKYDSPSLQPVIYIQYENEAAPYLPAHTYHRVLEAT